MGKGSESKIQTGLDPEGRLLGSGWRPAACLCPGTLGLWVEREPKLDQGRPFPIRLSGLTGSPPPAGQAPWAACREPLWSCGSLAPQE